LTWFDYMFLRVIKNTSETYVSLEQADIEYLFKVNEYLDIQEYLESAQYKAEEIKNNANKNRPKL